MTSLGHLVARSLATTQQDLDEALLIIRAHQAAAAALAELPEAPQAARDWAATQVADLQAVWLALDRCRWNRCPFPGTRQT